MLKLFDSVDELKNFVENEEKLRFFNQTSDDLSKDIENSKTIKIKYSNNIYKGRLYLYIRKLKSKYLLIAGGKNLIKK